MDDDLPRIELYQFSYYDPLRKRWMRARYRATLSDIREHYPEHRIEGEPEIRSGKGSGFMPPGHR